MSAHEFYTLDQICILHGTDKGSKHQYTPHNYAYFYENLLGDLRSKPIKLLEIGVGGGESIRAWLDYFQDARVYGVDIVKGTNEWNTPGKSPTDRYTFIHNDQNDPTGWACFLADTGGEFNVVVDDGAHTSQSIINSFECLWPSVRPGGMYFVEDIGCSLTPGSVFLSAGFPTHMDWIKSIEEKMHSGPSDVAMVSAIKELICIRKCQAS